MKLYVGNLSFQTTEQNITELFSPHGEVREVKIITDRETQRPRGFAFVTMADSASGQAAVNALNGHSFEGRPLTVNEAKPMESRR